MSIKLGKFRKLTSQNIGAEVNKRLILYKVALQDPDNSKPAKIMLVLSPYGKDVITIYLHDKFNTPIWIKGKSNKPKIAYEVFKIENDQNNLGEALKKEFNKAQSDQSVLIGLFVIDPDAKYETEISPKDRSHFLGLYNTNTGNKLSKKQVKTLNNLINQIINIQNKKKSKAKKQNK